jgi:lipoprotein-anchoring transpeptidase ErfK/SrfK
MDFLLRSISVHNEQGAVEMGKRTGKTKAIFAVLALFLATAAFAQSEQTAATDLVRRVVLVSIPDRKLAVLEGNVVLATFPVAVGADVSPSPTGEFQIVNRLAHPTYYHAGKVIPAGGENPLGTRWLGLSQKGYGIHGTNAPSSVGHAASHGCIRLRNRDVERLFAMLRVGDTVVIRGERDDHVAQVFGDAADKTIVPVQTASAAGGQ